MELIVIGSGSTGNGYILRDKEGYSLILEAGVTVEKLKKSLQYDISKVVGCLGSHIHGDHLKHHKAYQKYGIDIYTGESNGVAGHRFKAIKEGVQMMIGPYKVKAFALEHDVECFGFLIHHPEMGLTCFITDTSYCKYKFPKLNNIILEANYSMDILTKRFIDGDLNAMVRNRVIESHMSLETAMEFLEANDLSKVNKIVLIHLSSGNADPETFRKTVRDRFLTTVEIASKGKIIELNVNPF